MPRNPDDPPFAYAVMRDNEYGEVVLCHETTNGDHALQYARGIVREDRARRVWIEIEPRDARRD